MIGTVRTIAAAFMLLATLPALAQDQSRVVVDCDNDIAKNHMGVKPFYLIHQITSDAFFDTGLNNTVSVDEMGEVLKGVLYGVSPTYDAVVTIKQDAGHEVRMEFKMKEHPEHGQTLVMKMNFDEETRKLTPQITRNSGMLRWYKIWDGKLTAGEDIYTKDHEEELDNPIEKVHFLLFDDNPSNDSRAKGMVETLTSNAQQRLFSMAFQGHIAMMSSDTRGAESALRKLKNYYADNRNELKEFTSVPALAEAELSLYRTLK